MGPQPGYNLTGTAAALAKLAAARQVLARGRRLIWTDDAETPTSGPVFPDQPPQSPEGWEWWLLWVTKKAIKADYLVHHGAPSTSPRDNRTHLVHATCSRFSSWLPKVIGSIGGRRVAVRGR